MSNLRQIGLGVMAYAGENDDWYPYRQASSDGIYGAAATIKDVGIDDRPHINAAFPIDDLMICPLSPAPAGFSLMAEPTNNWVYTSYSMWFGAMFRQGQTDTAMWRVSDRPAWGGTTFNVLASSLNRNWVNNNQLSSHPDYYTSILTREVLENPHRRVLYSAYGADYNPAVLIDQTFLFDDGAVTSLRKLGYVDDRTEAVPFYAGQPGWSVWSYLPPAQ